jgi:hypothetical protein
VALVHLLFLLAFLLTDKLTLHKADMRPMTIYRVPEQPAAPRTPAAAGRPSGVTRLPSAAPRLQGPMILVRPDQPLPPTLPGLDLSIHSGAPPSLDRLAPPSRETQLRQFFKDSAEENRQAREPSGGEDCRSLLARDRDVGTLSASPFRDPLPAETICTARRSAQDLARRNQRFAPQ